IDVVGVFIYPGNWVMAIPKVVKNMDTYQPEKCIFRYRRIPGLLIQKGSPTPLVSWTAHSIR
ncbi:MAG: hypothetical protein Q7W05_07395, partial [Deltaproteobacteria bacterium]|nr:hypothetical protein [Deltaproteobacteria bacterium]